MSKLDELIRELCPNGVEYKRIGELAEYEQPTKYIVKSTDYSDNFEIPVLTAGQTFILGYTNETEGIYTASKENPVIIFDDFTGAFKWVDFPFKVKSSAMKILTAKTDITSLRYIFHLMGYLNFSSDEHKRLWIRTYSEFLVPVPPLEVQREIVRILDNFTELTARKKQYEYYRDELLTFDISIPKVRLGDICSVITKGTTPKSYTKSGVSFVKTESFDGTRIVPEKLSYVDEETHTTFLKRSILQENDILITIAGATIGKCAMVPKEILPANTNQALAIIRLSEGNSPKYVMYLLQSDLMKRYMQKNIKGSAQPNLNLQQLNDFVIPLPSLNVQNRLVNVLDNFDAICSDLNIGLPAEIEARQKQYEFYRDALLTYAATGKIILTDRQTDRQTDKYNALIRLCQYVFGFVMLPLSEICNSISSGKAKTKDDIGKYPVYGSTGIIARTDKAVYNKMNILVARVGANAGYTHLAQGGYDVSDNTLIVDVKSEYSLKYIYYQLVNIGLNRYAKGGGQPLVTAGQIKEVVLPVPMKQEQERIVSILDRFDSLCNSISEGLPGEIEARNKQYEFYRDKLLSFKQL